MNPRFLPLLLFDDIAQSGTVIATNPDIAIGAPGDLSNNDTLDFGSHLEDSDDVSARKTFTVTNEGDATLNLAQNSIYLDEGGGFVFQSSPSTNTAPRTIEPGGLGIAFTVKLATSNPGSKTGTLTVESDDPDEDPFIVNLTGFVIEITSSSESSRHLPTISRMPNIPTLGRV